MTELATAGPGAGTLALRSDQQDWTDHQRAALAQIGVDRATPGDLAVFMHVSQRTGLDPFSRQIYMIARGGKWTIQTGIDGFRVIAARHREYAGQVGPEWCGDDGNWRPFWAGQTPPVAARVGVLHRDFDQPVWGVAMFSEFTAGNSMWKDKSAHMLAKCAEALALRKAFPHDLAGLLTPEEADRDDRPTRARAVVQHDERPITVAELTGGTPVPVGVDPGERMSQVQQGKLFALLRDAEIEDRKVWASGILGREIGSYGELSVVDAGLLIDRLELGVAALAGEAEQGATDADTRGES